MYPHDFEKCHEIRIDQYHTKKAEEDEKQRKALYEKFSKISNKYLTLERLIAKDNYCLVAKSPDDLVKEGQALHHCVGKMGYDQKFVNEETLIFFVRTQTNPETPFVTLEYSIKSHKILQCYADHNTRPKQEILNYLNNVWLPYANKQIKKLAI